MKFNTQSKPQTSRPADPEHDTRVTIPHDEIPWSTGEYEVHPAGIFRAEFTGYESFFDTKFGSEKPRLQLQFYTDAETETDEGAQISSWTSPSLTPKCKFPGFLQAIGLDLAEVRAQIKEKKFSLDPYIGAKLRICVEHEPRGDGQGVSAVIKSFQSLKSGSAAEQPAEEKPTKPSRRAKWEDE